MVCHLALTQLFPAGGVRLLGGYVNDFNGRAGKRDVFSAFLQALQMQEHGLPNQANRLRARFTHNGTTGEIRHISAVKVGPFFQYYGVPHEFHFTAD